jgi:hypothetical protein
MKKLKKELLFSGHTAQCDPRLSRYAGVDAVDHISKPLPNSSKGSNGLEATSDAALGVVRRIDWRFLLPDPTLSQVAHIGPAQTTLLESLRLFSESLTVIGMPCENAGMTGQTWLWQGDHPTRRCERLLTWSGQVALCTSRPTDHSGPDGCGGATAVG